MVGKIAQGVLVCGWLSCGLSGLAQAQDKPRVGPLSRQDVLKVQELIKTGKSEEASVRLGEGGWCVRQVEPEVSSALIAQFHADVGVMARRAGKRDEALSCMTYALRRKGNADQASALYEASLLMAKMPGKELAVAGALIGDDLSESSSTRQGRLESMKSFAGLALPVQRVLDSISEAEDMRESSCPDAEAQDRIKAWRTADIVYLCLLRDLSAQYAAEPDKLPAALSRSLLLSAARYWPREAYLSKMTKAERRFVFERAQRLDVVPFKPLPAGMTIAQYLFMASFEHYKIKPGMSRNKVLDIKALEGARVKEDEGSLKYEVEHTSHRIDEAYTFHTYHVCAGHDDSPGSAWFVHDASGAFIALEKEGTFQVVRLGGTELCAELRASAKLVTQVDAMHGLIRVRLLSQSYSGNGPFTTTVKDITCHANMKTPSCLINAFEEVTYGLDDFTELDVESHDFKSSDQEFGGRADISNRLAPLVGFVEGKAVLTGGTPFSDYEALEGKTFEEVVERAPSRPQRAKPDVTPGE